MDKIKVNTIILTDSFPNLIASEVKYLESVGHSFILVTDTLNCKTSSNKVLLLNTKSLSAPLFFKSISILFSSSELARISSWNFKSFYFKFKTAFVWSLEAAKIVKQIEEKVDLGSVNRLYSYWGDYRALAIIELGKKYGIPTVSRFHGWDLYVERHPFDYLPFREYYAKKNSELSFISENGKKYFQHRYTNKSNLTVNYLGTERLFPVNQKKRDGNFYRIVSCSSLTPEKRIDLLIEVILKVQEVENVEWVHFGSGKKLIAYQERFSKIKGNKEIQFKGFVLNEEIQRFYSENQVDLFINVSETEGLPVSMMEAASYGIPILGTDVGGVSEIVRVNQNGLLVEKDSSVEEIANAILKYLQISEEKRKEFSLNSEAVWGSNFDARVNFEKFEERFLL